MKRSYQPTNDVLPNQKHDNDDLEDDAHTYLFDHQLLNDSTNTRYLYLSPIEQSRSNERDKEKGKGRERTN